MEPEATRRAKDPIERQIRAYLQQHPKATDTIEGITQWWLGRDCNLAELRRVQLALERLLSKRILVPVHRKGQPIYYRQPDAGSAETR